MVKIDVNKIKNKIFCASAGKLLKLLPDNAVDLLLIDPPYGIDYMGQLKSNFGGKQLSQSRYYWHVYGDKDSTWDKSRISAELLNECLRVSKNQIIWGGNYYADLLKPSQGFLCWNKIQRNFSLADGELAWTSYDRAMRIFDYSRAQMNTDTTVKIHDTQKPVKLFEWCINKAKLKAGAVILDCFCGSGTTAIAAYNTGYDFICSDIDAEMVTKAKARFAGHTEQLKFIQPSHINNVTQLEIGGGVLYDN